MMHRCSSSQGNMVGPCSCGLFHSQSNSFSMLFSMPNHHKSFDETDMYPYTSSSSSVDCTLSLGTPSTRLCEDVDDRRSRHDRRSGTSNSCMSNFCWDLLQNNKNTTTPNNYSQQSSKTSRGNGNGGNSSGNDPLLARRCANCDTTSTPLWRNGPRGPKSLCNACGIRFKKEERRATAANASNSSATMLEQQHHGYGHHNNSWVHQSQKMPCFSQVNEFSLFPLSPSPIDGVTTG
ncbi:Zinc finger, GATA-type [Corchorus olitorius]|uniref:Zinc finger, GATA-type n=1 Tax=Corchorus olitorius TaxID=93759 RepID=A0A1R3IPB3_9ROSI|nr:Zinc finger, GATA-type [Corchorus olitorius]